MSESKKFAPNFEQLKDRTPTPDSFQVKNSLMVFLSEARDDTVKKAVLENLQTKEKTEMGFQMCRVLFRFDTNMATIRLYDERQKVPVMDISLEALKTLVATQ